MTSDRDPDRTTVTRPTDASRSAELAAASERLRALGIDDEVIFSGTAEEVIAYLEATDACVRSA